MLKSVRPVFSVAVEGEVDEAVVRKLAEDAGASVAYAYGKNGKQRLLRSLRGYNEAARFSPWLVLVDLDQDFDCAPLLCEQYLPAPSPSMCFCVAVRKVESWLLADRPSIARFLKVPVSSVPAQPDRLPNAKGELARLASRSRNRGIRADMTPRPGSGREVGAAYSSRVREFVDQLWNPQAAEVHSESLRRCRRRLRGLVKRAG